MRVSDYELTTLAAGLPPPDGDFDRVLTAMARELLAAWSRMPTCEYGDDPRLPSRRHRRHRVDSRLRDGAS